MARCRENMQDYMVGLHHEGLKPEVVLLMAVIKQAVIDGLEIQPRYEAYESIKGKKRIGDQREFRIKKEYGESVSAVRFLLSKQLDIFMSHYDLDTFISTDMVRSNFKRLLGRGYERLLWA